MFKLSGHLSSKETFSLRVEYYLHYDGYSRSFGFGDGTLIIWSYTKKSTIDDFLLSAAAFAKEYKYDMNIICKELPALTKGQNKILQSILYRI